MDDRYVPIKKPPQTGETLANLPLLKNYAEILHTAESNVQNGYGAYYMKKAASREVSYCYTLNSIYRELLKWQNKQPDNPDIPQLRKEAVDLFQEVLPKEFPHIGENYEIKPDFIEFDTKDAVTGNILNPQQIDIEEESQAKFQSILTQLDAFLNKNEPNQVYEEGSDQERERQKKFDEVSFGALRKMQYYLAEKIENKHVYSFQSTDEKSRAYRNTLKKQIEALTNINKENAFGFERNQQIVSNTLDGLEMRMVWCQEPPYEAEFVDNLDGMRKDLQREQTPPEFYNTKLPVFLDLCKNLEEFNPEETKKMSALMKEFMDKPSKEKLVEVIDETQRVAMDLREIDHAKSMAMRAAWDGAIRNPIRKNLSPVIRDILKTRDLMYRTNLTPSEKIKCEAYLNANYTIEDYQKEIQKSKIWNVCKQVPQFKNLENELLKQLKTMSIPPQSVANFKYEDFAHIINQRGIRDCSISPADREEYVKNLVANHEKELRRMLIAFYKKKHTLSLTLKGKRKGKSRAEISTSIMDKAKKETNATINLMKTGKVSEDFNAHHIFPLSNISYFERMTGKNFTEINKHILFINKGIHELLHINENAMDEKGRLHLGKDMACRTKYVHQDRILQNNEEEVIGYCNRAVMGIIMPKDNIEAMVDFNCYLFTQEKLSENIKIQEQTIEYREAYDAFMLSKAQDRALKVFENIPKDESQTSKSVSLLSRLLENMSSAREYCSISENFNQLKQNVTQTIQQEKREPTAVEQSVLESKLKYYQPLTVVPHVSSSKMSMFLTQAVALLNNKAKEVVMSVQNTLQSIQPILHPEMDKARQMVKNKNDENEHQTPTIPLQPQKTERQPHVSRQSKQYA